MIAHRSVAGRLTRNRASRLPAAATTLGVLALVLAALNTGPGTTMELPSLPPCPSAQPELTVLVPDVSSSVIDSDGADPDGRSFVEARLLAEHLAEHPCSEDDRMAAVIFANRSVEIPPTPLTSLSVLRTTLRRPPTKEIGDGTDLAPALERVEQLVERYPDHRPTIVLLSDMVIGEDTTERVHGMLRGLPAGSVHLVALGTHDPRFDQDFSTVTSLDGVAPGSVASTIAALIATTRMDLR